MTLIIEDASKALQRAIKPMPKLYKARSKVKGHKANLMQEAIKEIKNGEYEVCKDFEEYKKAMKS